MKIGNTVKAAVKAVTTPWMREKLKQLLFQSGIRLRRVVPRAPDRSLPFGVNVIGHFRGDFGLGESCRLVAGALERSDIPLAVINVPQNGAAAETNMAWEPAERSDYPYSVNLIHLNPNELANAVWRLEPEQLRTHYNIAFWLWELEEFPRQWRYAYQLFDEIWTPAEFITRTMKKATDLPVYTMPYGLVSPRVDSACGRAFFGLPADRFLYMVTYDGSSVSARKNPEGAIRAYMQAFSPSDGDVGIVIKATHEEPAALDSLRQMLSGYPNVYFLTENYSREVFNSLIQCVDVYVSLHRAEGFGLVMAEAMLLGTPVIATDWSANTEFMDVETACMVGAQIVELDRDYPPYRAGCHWAAPDEEQAAQWMKRLYEDRPFGAALAKRARERLEQSYSVEKAALRMRQRLQEIGQGTDRRV